MKYYIKFCIGYIAGTALCAATVVLICLVAVIAKNGAVGIFFALLGVSVFSLVTGVAMYIADLEMRTARMRMEYYK